MRNVKRTGTPAGFGFVRVCARDIAAENKKKRKPWAPETRWWAARQGRADINCYW